MSPLESLPDRPIYYTTFGTFLDNCLDVGAFTYVGYLSGRCVSEFQKYSGKSLIHNFFGKSETFNLQSATICCTLFVIIDRFVQGLLSRFAKINLHPHSPGHLILTAINITAAISLFNSFAPEFKQPCIESHLAVAVILTAITIYSAVLFVSSIFKTRL